jgi:prepilin peptidase CpaA
MGSAISSILLAVLAAMLLAACWCDLKARTIPNLLNLAVAVLAIPFWWSLGLALWPDIAWQAGVGVLVFGLFAIAFAMGAMGGGDVKLVAAIALWLPAQSVIALLFIMSVAGGALTLAMLVRHKLARKAGQLEIPYGVAIAFGGLWLIGERFLNQFG